ncbi:MAG: ATP-dependent Clp protease proteolytic subunit [Leptospiraceae bacterium]|nr:ATP-dependent Clp protease proteolytic subunit [Leptospiraceae bacterium]MDW8306511.1 ATP-dependent Clp protease proteolytic subunit [Leptospiraceae bacterium]
MDIQLMVSWQEFGKSEEEISEEKPAKLTTLREKIQEKFLSRRQVFLWGPVTDRSAEIITERLIYLELENPGKPILFFINSPGGVISSGMAIYDVMRMISSPVYTITMGMAASMGAILLCAGEKGHRYVFPHARVMIHQPLISGQIIAPAIDIKIHAEEIKKTRDELNRILSEATGQKIEKIEKDTDRDFYMNAREAVDYGLADKILDSFSFLEELTEVAKKDKKTKS